MHRRILGPLIGLAVAAALLGCGGGDKASDVTSATAQACKAELTKIIDRALAAGAAGQEPQISDADKPAVCDQVADDVGRTITAEITRETSEKARKQIQANLEAGNAGASTGSAGEVSAGQAAEPTKLPVGNAEWRLEKADLKASSLGFFGGTLAIRYLGTEQAILAATTPGDLIVYQGGKKVATVLFTVGAPDSGELSVATVISEDDFVPGPYTFTLQFE